MYNSANSWKIPDHSIRAELHKLTIPQLRFLFNQLQTWLKTKQFHAPINWNRFCEVRSSENFFLWCAAFLMRTANFNANQQLIELFFQGNTFKNKCPPINSSIYFGSFESQHILTITESNLNYKISMINSKNNPFSTFVNFIITWVYDFIGYPSQCLACNFPVN